jgi:hypothetical protein
MSTQSQGAESGPAVDSQSEPEFKEYLVRRDADGPLSFAGVLLAKATRQSGGLMANMMSDTLEGAVYRTRGGKFITSLSKTRQMSLVANIFATDVEEEAGPDSSGGYHKAAVHDTFEDAVKWFRPGRLTDEIRRQLGLDKPVRIE